MEVWYCVNACTIGGPTRVADKINMLRSLTGCAIRVIVRKNKCIHDDFPSLDSFDSYEFGWEVTKTLLGS